MEDTFNFDSFKKDFLTKKNLTIVGVITAIIIAVIVIFNIPKNNDDNNPVEFSSVMKTPTLSTPVLYDFYNGSIGYHSYDLIENAMTEYDTPTWETGFAVIAKNNNGDTWISFYPGSGEPYTVPCAGYAPVSVNLQKNNFDDAVSSLVEDDYTFYVYSTVEHTNPNGSIQIGNDSINLVLNNSTMMDDLTDGVGYPAEWLRNYDILVENLKTLKNVNINDSYWDDINYLSSYVCHTNNNDDINYYFQLIGENKFNSMSVPFAIVDLNNIESINEYLSNINAQTLTQAMNAQQYAPYEH